MNPASSNLETHAKRNSLGVNCNVYKQLLRTLSARSNVHTHQPAPTNVNRTYTRIEFQEPFLEVTLSEKNQNQRKKIIVATRNISVGGISLLHSNFIYPGTRLSSTITKLDGSTHPFAGEVKRCEHRGGVVHEIGVQFDHSIHVQEFVQSDLFESPLSVERVQPEEINGNVLGIGADLRTHTKPVTRLTNINDTYITDMSELDEQDLEKYHLIMVGMDAGEMTGSELTRVLRQRGFMRPILLVGDATQAVQKQQISYSDADLFVPMPIERDRFLRSLAEYLMQEWSSEQLKQIRTLRTSNNLEMLHDQLRTLGDTLRRQCDDQDAVKAYITLASIRNLATLLGIKALQSTAHKICDEIADSGDIESHKDLLDELLAGCS